MSSDYIVVYSPLFKQSLARLKRHIETKESRLSANKMLRATAQLINTRLSNEAHDQAACERLVDLGVNKFRQIEVQKHQSLFYKVEDKLIVVLAIVDQGQNIADLLYDAMMRY